MTPQEKKALANAKESLEDFPHTIMAEYLERKNLEILVKMIEKYEKERAEKNGI